MKPEDLERIAALLEAQEWIFAKTMPHNPHHYTLRKKWMQDADFVWVVEMIRRHGYVENFKGRPYTLLNVNGHKYWTMGNPIEETTLINRKEIGQP